MKPNIEMTWQVAMPVLIKQVQSKDLNQAHSAISELMRIAEHLDGNVPVVDKTKPKKKPYKRQYTRTCPECGKGYKGAVGLGIHMRRAHGKDQPKDPVESKVAPGVISKTSNAVPRFF